MACRLAESSSESRTSFTSEENDVLLQAYENGMRSTGALHSAQLAEISSRINKPVSVIKNWIGNQNRKRCTQDISESDPKPSQKLRKLSSYNVFAQEFMKSDEGKQITQLSQKNRVIAQKWKELSVEEKDKYKSTAPNAPVNQWKEAQKILRNFNTNCDWCQHCGSECLYVLTHKSNFYVGGTEIGKEFLRINPMFAGNFLSFSKKDTEPLPTSSDGLRKAVQAILNSKYALAVGNPKARVPYSSIASGKVVVENFPEGLKFGPPSSFGNASLKKIIDCAEEISFKITPA